MFGLPPILVYVDHTARFERNTGIQRCVRSLSRAWLSMGAPLQPVVWDRQIQQLVPASRQARRHLARWEGPAPEAWLDAPQLVTANWLLVAELVSGPHNPEAWQLQREAHRLQLQIAWLFHDAIPVRWSHLYGAQANQAAQAHAAYMNGLAEFDLVLANSHTTAGHLRQHWQQQNLTPRARLKALPLATELPGQDRSPAPCGGEDLVLCVGSLEPRKNHLGLLKAFTLLAALGRWPRSHTLVLVGWPNDRRVVQAVERACRLGLPLRWEPKVDDARLRQLYGKTAFSVYPSLEEGFGLPVAESLWHRRPCLCSGEGALGELASGGGCYTVATKNWRALMLALDQLLHDPRLRQQLQRQITQRSPRLWRDVAAEWLDQIKAASR